MSNIDLPQNFKIVSATAGCRTTNGGVTFDVIDLTDAIKVWIVAHFRQVAGHATTIQPVTGISIASCATAITFATRWWLNVDISATDTLAAQTAATSCACNVAAADQLMVIEIDPAEITAQLGTYHCLGGTIASSGGATNFVSAVYYIQTAYPQATPATAIV